MCRNNVNNSYPLASRRCWARFKFLPRKYHLLYAFQISMVFKIILEEENTSISYTEEEDISQTTQRISVFYIDFLIKARKNTRTETSWKFGIRFRSSPRFEYASPIVCFRSALFFAILNGNSSIFFFQIQELIELNYPSSSFSSFSFPRSSIISRTFYTRIYIYTKIQCKSYLAWAREKRIDHRSIISLQYKFVTHIGETFRNEEEEKEERGIAVTWQLNHPLKSRSNVREREIGR